MLRRHLAPLLAIAAITAPASALAQSKLTDHTLRRDPAPKAPAVAVGDVSFIEGHWQGEAFGGIVEEFWAPALGGSMIGTFKLVVDGALEFQELMNVRPDSAAGLALTVKHFDAAMNAWEEKEEMVRFPFIKVEGRTAYFSGLTIERASDDRLNLYLAMTAEDGSTSEVEMTYYRVGSAAHAAWSEQHRDILRQ